MLNSLPNRWERASRARRVKEYLLEWYYDARNRLLASPRFQGWAEGFPITRPIARRCSRALFDLCAGFVYSQVLVACVRLRVLEILSEGAIDRDRLAARIGLSAEATDWLLRAAIALDLVVHRSDCRFGLGVLGAALIGNPAICAMVQHHALLYRDLTDPVALLAKRPRDTELAGYWPYADAQAPAGLQHHHVAPYTALMAASQSLFADDLLDAYAFARHRRLIDIGGGDGSFLIAAGIRAPALELRLFDLPAVVETARKRFRDSGMNARAHATGGDFHSEALPTGADLATLIRILHDHSDGPALALLRKVRNALPAGGVLLVAEPMAETPGAEPVGHAYFGFYLLAMGSGRPRSMRENRDLLRAAGFARVRKLATRRPFLVSALVATK